MGKTNMFDGDLPDPIDPHVLGADDHDRALRPGATYVPGRGREGSPDTVDLEVQPLTDGRTAVLAYSSLHRLVECLGERQPWVELPATIDAATLQLRTGVDVVYWDQELPQHLRCEDGDSARS